MNYLGIDYGKKRIGLSFGDSDVRVAVPIDPILVKFQENTISALRKIIHQRNIQEIVMGYPFNLDGSISDTAREIDKFIFILEKEFLMKVHRIDEQLTSFQASSDSAVFIKKSKKSLKNKIAKRRSAVLDSQSATLILQDFLDIRYS